MCRLACMVLWWTLFQYIKSRMWDMMDQRYVNNLARFRSVRSFILITRKVFHLDFCIETPCCCPSEGHQHGGRKVTETISLNFAVETKSYSSRVPINVINTSSSERTVQLAKT